MTTTASTAPAKSARGGPDGGGWVSGDGRPPGPALAAIVTFSGQAITASVTTLAHKTRG
jgi:hypothetical protein